MLLALLLTCNRVTAGDRVEDYFAELNAFQADFSQLVKDSDGQELQNSQGGVWIQRPGRFRWDYRTPYRQLIVADGEFIWTYDEDLEQATVKTVDATLSSTPAMLLSGFRPLAEVMTWRMLGEREGALWYRLDPKQADSAVEEVRIAFQQDQLSIIEVFDGFGNHTRIQFTNISRNEKLDAGLFEMRLPAGTDIIGDTP